MKRRHSLAGLAIVAVFLLAFLVRQPLAAQAPAAWLDKAPVTWHRAGDPVPMAPRGTETRDALAKRCGSTALAESADGRALSRAGWVPFLHLDRELARDDVTVLGGMAAAGPGCEAEVFNLFVFVGGAFAGTVSPVVMTRNHDGEVGAVRLTASDAMTAEFARYQPGDAECCPSSRVRMTYHVQRGRGDSAVLQPVEARQIR